MKKRIRLPIVNTFNTRTSAANTLPATSSIVGVGMVGVMVVGQTIDPSSKDARYVNCFKHTVENQATGEKRIYCVKRAGLQSFSTPQTGSIGTAGLVWTGCATPTSFVSAFGGTNSSIYIGTTQLVTNNGTTTIITGKATNISETTVSNTATLYITSSDNTGWYYQAGGTLTTGTVTKIADAQYPGNNGLTLAGFGAHMDGYTFQMDTLGGIWNTDLNSITSWTATGTLTANIYPDKGIGCVKFKQYIVAFGTESMEFFYNAGNASGSPLSRIPNMAQKIGAVSADAIVSISDNLFFCGSTPQGGLSIYLFDGQISRVSTPEIDGVLLLAGAGGIKLTALRDYGMSFIVVKAGNYQYAYCVEEKFWFVWVTQLGFTRFSALSTGTSQVAYGVSELVTTGKIYTINPQSRVFQDDGVGYSARAQLQTIDPGDGAFVSYDEAQIVADVESGTSDLSLVWSDDDYTTWSNSRTLSLASSIPRTRALGVTKNPRAFAAIHSDNTPMRVLELRLLVNIGS